MEIELNIKSFQFLVLTFYALYKYTERERERNWRK